MSTGGAGIGAVTGALKGQTTETGIVRGTVIGSLAGVVVAVELLDSCLQGELLSKVRCFGGQQLAVTITVAFFRRHHYVF